MKHREQLELVFEAPDRRICHLDECEVDISHKQETAKYCSKRHAALGSHRRRARRNQAPRKCRLEACGVDISDMIGQARFCSPEHRRKSQLHRDKKRRKEFRRRSLVSHPHPTGFCELKSCGVDISHRRASTRFCSWEHAEVGRVLGLPHVVEEFREDWFNMVDFGIRELREKYGTALVRDVARALGLQQRPRNSAYKERGSTRRVYQDGNGYVMVRVGADHRMAKVAQGGGHYVLEHRLIMAEMIGRRLKDWETVHHRDGVRHNNAPENLHLWDGNHGSGTYYEDTAGKVEALEARNAELESIVAALDGVLGEVLTSSEGPT